MVMTEKGGSGKRRIEITDIANAKTMKMEAFDWLFCMSATDVGSLLLGQRTKDGMLQISEIAYSGEWNEKKAFIYDTYLAAHPFARVSSIALKEGAMIVQIQDGAETNLHFIDSEEERVTGTAVLKPIDNLFFLTQVMETDAGFCGIERSWLSSLQRNVYRMRLISENHEETMLPLGEGLCLGMHVKEGRQVITLEMAREPEQYSLCFYALNGVQ